MTKEEFLQAHLEDLQKQIWLLEISRDLAKEAVAQTNDKKELGQIIEVFNNLEMQLQGLEKRKQFVWRILHDNTQVDDSKKEDQRFAAV